MLILKTKRRLGFSIVELIIAVGIISILASLALPAFIKQVRRSKTASAIGSLRNIYDGETVYYVGDKVNRTGTRLSTMFVACPTTPAAVPAGIKSVGDWNQAEWKTINFSLDSATSFSFTVDASGVATSASFTARAEGDLDGDLIYSTFERTARVNQSNGDIQGVNGVYMVREIE